MLAKVPLFHYQFSMTMHKKCTETRQGESEIERERAKDRESATLESRVESSRVENFATLLQRMFFSFHATAKRSKNALAKVEKPVQVAS